MGIVACRKPALSEVFKSLRLISPKTCKEGISKWGVAMQSKLHDVLTEKNKEAKINMDAASRFIDTGNRATAPRRDDDLYKVNC